MEKENKGKSKFWKGVLAGSLVTALAGFGIVGVATGISVIGRTVIENQAQNTTAEGSGSDAVRTQVNLKQVDAKISVLQQIIDRYFLFDEDAEQMETGIYKGMLAGLDDPYTVYYTPEEYFLYPEIPIFAKILQALYRYRYIRYAKFRFRYSLLEHLPE